MRKRDKELNWHGSKGKAPATFIGTLFKGLLVLFMLGVVTVVSLSLYVYVELQAVKGGNGELIEVDIPMGTSVKSIASILEENGVIKNDLVFYYYARYKNSTDFQAGTYYLEPGIKRDALITQLKSGKVYADSVKVSIPEGLEISEVAELLAEGNFVDKDRFLKVANDTNFTDISFFSEIPMDIPERENRLEGYLFPETYHIREGATEEEIVTMMLLQLEKELKEEWLTEIERKGMTLNEIMSLAAIIEREAVAKDERKTIAGVYYNRLEQGMKLQADATVQYALGEHTERVMYKDLEIDNPYNTYKYAGLPPSPIAIPGRDSIEVAIYPEEHDYFYYVTKKDGSYEHYFSKTYEEHKQNITRSKNN